MPKIESIRPGGTLSATFAEYLLPELLFGILRGNLTGRLDVALHPEVRNFICFKDGVPICVELPDANVSLVKMLIDSGRVNQAKGLDLLRRAEAGGTSELALLEKDGGLPAGALIQLEEQRARKQVVRLFDVGAVEFSFQEGADRPPTASLTILQPLPLVFEGLERTKDRKMIERLIAPHKGKAFQLAATYPMGVDPFEWGERIEAVVGTIEGAWTLEDLVARAVDPATASAMIVSLSLAGMVEERTLNKKPEVAPALRIDPRMVPDDADPDTLATPREAPKAKDPSGLVIHYKSGGKQKPSKAEPPASSPAVRPITSPQGTTPIDQNDELESVRARLAQYDGKSYYQILRVAPGTDIGQVERAYRFLVRRPEGGDPDDAGARALKGLYHEAFECLADPERAKRYKALAEWAEKSSNAVREREAVEAEPKIERAFRSLGDGRMAEARALLDWARRLAPLRSDVPVLIELTKIMADPSGVDSLSLATSLVAERQKMPDDGRIKMAYAYCLALEEEPVAARTLLDSIPDREHPMVKRITSMMSG